MQPCRLSSPKINASRTPGLLRRISALALPMSLAQQERSLPRCWRWWAVLSPHHPATHVHTGEQNPPPWGTAPGRRRWGQPWRRRFYCRRLQTLPVEIFHPRQLFGMLLVLAAEGSCRTGRCWDSSAGRLRGGRPGNWGLPPPPRPRCADRTSWNDPPSSGNSWHSQRRGEGAGMLVDGVWWLRWGLVASDLLSP